MPQLDIDLPASETRVRIPAQYLKPNTLYQFEVLATEESGNQTITEGFFCTAGIPDCEGALIDVAIRRDPRLSRAYSTTVFCRAWGEPLSECGWLAGSDAGPAWDGEPDARRLHRRHRA